LRQGGRKKKRKKRDACGICKSPPMIDPIKFARGISVKYQPASSGELTWKNRVTDHRGFKYNDLRSCMEGNALGEVMDGVAKVLQQQELEEAIAMDAVE